MPFTCLNCSAEVQPGLNACQVCAEPVAEDVIGQNKAAEPESTLSSASPMEPPDIRSSAIDPPAGAEIEMVVDNQSRLESLESIDLASLNADDWIEHVSTIESILESEELVPNLLANNTVPVRVDQKEILARAVSIANKGVQQFGLSATSSFAYLCAGWVALQSGKLIDADFYFDRVNEIADAKMDPNIKSDAESGLALLAYLTGNYDLAIRLNQKALKRFEDWGETNRLVEPLGRLLDVYIKQKDIGSALSVAARTLEIQEKEGSPQSVDSAQAMVDDIQNIINGESGAVVDLPLTQDKSDTEQSLDGTATVEDPTYSPSGYGETDESQPEVKATVDNEILTTAKAVADSTTIAPAETLSDRPAGSTSEADLESVQFDIGSLSIDQWKLAT
ncbi:tetratricopeptide repeat protein, partial [Dehalococcoides mccartyi]|nr:tetratricopeptide repeat protein [Dehalococcoides mccartyi]